MVPMIIPKTAVFSVAGMKSLNSISENARLKYRSHDMPLMRDLGEEPADDAAEVDDGREQRHREDARQDAGHREVLEGIDGNGLERVDLFGHLHRAELGADARADAAGHEQCGHQRAGFPNQGDGETRGNHRFGAEALERRARVHRQHDANRKARGGDQRRGPPADLEDVAQDLAKLVGRQQRLTKCSQAEERNLAYQRQRPEDGGADSLEHDPSVLQRSGQTGVAELARLDRVDWIG